MGRTRSALTAAVAVVLGVGSGGGVAHAALPDGRAYELVSPSEKFGDVRQASGVAQPLSILGGDGFMFLAPIALPGSPNGRTNDYRAVRTPSGWTTEPLSPQAPRSPGDPATQRWDLTAATHDVLYKTSQPLDPADIDGQFGFDAYLRDPTGAFQWISTGPSDPNDPFNGVAWADLSDDGSRVVFGMQSPLVPDDPDGSGPVARLYLWQDGAVTLISRDTNGNVLPASSLSYPGTLHETSRDGSRVFFQSSYGGPIRVYVYEDGGAHPLVPAATMNQSFVEATPDGSLAFFTTQEQLTPDDTDSGIDLYEWRASDGSLVRISHGLGQADVEKGPIQVSDDGSRVYFIGTGAIAPGATAGARNVYEADAGTVRFVATVTSGGGEIASPVGLGGTCSDSNWRVTPDGQHLLFATSSPVTADDLDTKSDLFEYSAATQQLMRLSQGPGGGNGDIDTFFAGAPLAGANHVCTGKQGTEQHVMSDDGRYVFFESPESLVPEDKNTSFDVYEHDLQSGTTTLLSSGADNGDSLLADTSPSGRDVFIVTYDQLVPQDADTLSDIYDVRLGGGFPAPPAQPVPCTGDACQDAPHASPGDIWTPGSTTAKGDTVPPPTGKRATVSIARISAAQLRQLARTGKITLRIKPTGSGRIRADARAVVAGRFVSVGGASVTGHAGTTSHVRLRLSIAARKVLKRNGRLTLRITAQVSGGPASYVTVRLRTHPRDATSSHSSGAQR